MTAEGMLKVSIRYYAFEVAKDAWKEYVDGTGNKPKVDVSVLGNVFAGSVAGVVESMLIVVPAEMLKVRHMTQTHHASFMSVFRGIIQKEGFSALYKGGLATTLRQVTNHMVRFPVFFASSNYLKKSKGKDSINFVENLALGGFAGGCSTIVNTPLDTVKTRMQKADRPAGTTQGMIIRDLLRNEGVFAFWRGLSMRLLRVVPGQAITWAVVQKVSQYLRETLPK